LSRDCDEVSRVLHAYRSAINSDMRRVRDGAA
jgi:DNA-binding FrmR family transcriptional regulator